MSTETPRPPRATLTVAGKNIGLNRFVESALVGVLEGFFGALRDVGAGEVVITIPADRRTCRSHTPPPAC